MKLELAARVEQGRRPYNDDRALISKILIRESREYTLSTTPEIVAVCDGCGGYQGGGAAAELTLETLYRSDTSAIVHTAQIVAALDMAEKEIIKAKQAHPELSQMCTTIAGCIFDDDKTIIFHSGDSRVYRFDGECLARMTVDHSLLQEMIDEGNFVDPLSSFRPNRNVIRRAMGLGTTLPEVNDMIAPILPGEIYLICSDGLWDYIPEAEIIKILKESDSLLDKADALVSKAYNLGSDDNISVVLCKGDGQINYESNARIILD